MGGWLRGWGVGAALLSVQSPRVVGEEAHTTCAWGARHRHHHHPRAPPLLMEEAMRGASPPPSIRWARGLPDTARALSIILAPRETVLRVETCKVAVPHFTSCVQPPPHNSLSHHHPTPFHHRARACTSTNAQREPPVRFPPPLRSPNPQLLLPPNITPIIMAADATGTSGGAPALFSFLGDVSLSEVFRKFLLMQFPYEFEVRRGVCVVCGDGWMEQEDT